MAMSAEAQEAFDYLRASGVSVNVLRRLDDDALVAWRDSQQQAIVAENRRRNEEWRRRDEELRRESREKYAQTMTALQDAKYHTVVLHTEYTTWVHSRRDDGGVLVIRDDWHGVSWEETEALRKAALEEQFPVYVDDINTGRD